MLRANGGLIQSFLSRWFAASMLLPLAASAALPQADAVPGGVAILSVAPASEPAPTVTFRGARVLTVQDGEDWKAVIGLSLSLKPGEQQVAVAQGRDRRLLAFNVRPKEYEAQYLTITNKRLVEPAAEDMPRINREQELMSKANTTWTPALMDSLVFDAPSQGPFSARFGLRRFFNKQPRASHTGLDIAAPEGTPILAPASGTVIETGDFFFTGNVVFLDHGQGLVTMYIHMSRIDVVKGQTVKRGEQLGAVGKTGRTTGPHLHWAVSLNNTRVDPMLFLTPAARAAGEKPANASNNGKNKKP
jgi:murein DD-endopeptidase MepM/ murein hydrolase activator NlpD